MEWRGGKENALSSSSSVAGAGEGGGTLKKTIDEIKRSQKVVPVFQTRVTWVSPQWMIKQEKS